MTVDELKKEVSKIKWFHSIDLGNGIVTPGQCKNSAMMEILGMPEDLSGMTVLDIGAWDGYYSFEAERRGAKRVLATDHFCWDGEGWGTKTGFNLARRALNSNVDDMEIDVPDISPKKIGQFDLVLFMGVIYHLLHPMLGLERVYSVTKKQLILETHAAMLDWKQPVMEFYPGAEVNNDYTKWWGPNPPAIEAMLKTVGFKKTKINSIYPVSYDGTPFNKSPYARLVVHAWK